MTSIASRSNSHALLDALRPFVSATTDLSPKDIVDAWLRQAFLRYRETRKSSSFAPFNGYFSTQHGFREAIADFISQELADDEENNFSPRAVLERVVEGELVKVIEDAEIKSQQSQQNGENVALLENYGFELFGALLDLNSEQAYAWASRAVRSTSGFAQMRNAGNLPAPLVLLSSVVSDDTSGFGKADFLVAMMEWCANNTNLPEVASAARQLLPKTIRSIQAPHRAEKQISLIQKLITASGNAAPLISQIDRVILEEGVLLGRDLFESEGAKLRKAIDIELPGFIKRFNKTQKNNWNGSVILHEAFHEELEEDIECEDMSNDEQSLLRMVVTSSGRSPSELCLNYVPRPKSRTSFLQGARP